MADSLTTSLLYLVTMQVDKGNGSSLCDNKVNVITQEVLMYLEFLRGTIALVAVAGLIGIGVSGKDINPGILAGLTGAVSGYWGYCQGAKDTTSEAREQ